MRIARADLRRTLAEAAEQLPGVSIQWASTITSVQPSDDGKVVVTLSTGASQTADLLIAADGSASKLRTALRPNDTLQFAGPTCIYGICPIASLHPSGRANEFGTVISARGKRVSSPRRQQDNGMVFILARCLTLPHPQNSPSHQQRSPPCLLKRDEKDSPSSVKIRKGTTGY